MKHLFIFVYCVSTSRTGVQLARLHHTSEQTTFRSVLLLQEKITRASAIQNKQTNKQQTVQGYATKIRVNQGQMQSRIPNSSSNAFKIESPWLRSFP